MAPSPSQVMSSASVLSVAGQELGRWRPARTPAALARTLLEGHRGPTAVLTEQVDHPTTTPHRLKIKLARCA
ncbi:hypothetical protein ABK046_26540 [Streptomyces caeruleatus]